MNNKFWKILSEKIVYKTPWLKVVEETVELPDGSVVEDYSIVEFPSGAMVFALTPENEVIMVRQYRHAVKRMLLELPAGTYNIEKEKPETAARRELQEETGYIAEELLHLGTVYDYPTKAPHSISIYFANKIAYKPIVNKDAMENIEVIKVPLKKLDEYILDGTIAVSGTIAAISMAKSHVKKRES